MEIKSNLSAANAHAQSIAASAGALGVSASGISATQENNPETAMIESFAKVASLLSSYAKSLASGAGQISSIAEAMAQKDSELLQGMQAGADA